MRIGICGKGGSGKTAISNCLALAAEKRGINTWYFDCDVNQAGAERFGISKNYVPSLCENGNSIKHFLKGENKRIDSANEMFKTTPPGIGSELITVKKYPELINKLSYKKSDNLRLFRSGTIDKDSSGHRCHHYSLGYVEMLLTHTIDTNEDLVILDMTAGIDVFSSPIFCYLDMIVVLVNPSLYSFDVLKEFEEMKPEEVDTEIAVVLNKFNGDVDNSVWDKLLAEQNVLSSMEQTNYFNEIENKLLLNTIDGSKDIDFTLPDSLTKSLNKVIDYLSTKDRDWDQLLGNIHKYHKINCDGWINAQVGKSLTEQIDKDFKYQDNL